MLDDFGHELEMTDSKLQQTVLKVEKVLRLSDGKVFFFVSESFFFFFAYHSWTLHYTRCRCIEHSCESCSLHVMVDHFFRKEHLTNVY